jgi:predicted dehydrogenase
MNVALVGAGQIAAVHLACLRTIPAVRVVGVCDRSAATAAAIAERFGIGYSTTDITALLAS